VSSIIGPLAVAASPGSPTPPFGPGSRYYGVATSSYTAPDGTGHAYLQRRFVPDPAGLQVLQQIQVTDPSQRLDNLAAAVLGDPLQYWRICDANWVLQPADLMQAGLTVRVALPQGIAGVPGA
jgi:hypothetical protein